MALTRLSSKLVRHKGAILSDVLRPSIWTYLTDKDKAMLTSTTGAEVVCDYALAAAIEDGLMELYLPPVKGVYMLGEKPATLPLGFMLYGYCRKPYTVANDDSFLNTGTVIRVARGYNFPFYSTGRHVFRDINFDGRDKQSSSLLWSSSSSTQFNGTRFEGCGIYRFKVGLGWQNYTATLFATRCSISGNGDGIKNLIDSNVVATVVNANGRGVALLAGANNNSFIGVRCEWNNGDNYYAYNAVENIIQGELCDRAGRGGIVAAGTASWIVDGTMVRRSGANTPADDNYSANIVCVDNGSVTLNGVVFSRGRNDDGTGIVSPSYCISTIGGGKPSVIASGCDMEGEYTKVHNEKLVAIKNITGCRGYVDTVTNGLSKVISGRSCLDYKTGTLNADAPLELALSTIPPSQYGHYLVRTLVVECRLSSALFDIIKVPLIFQYDGSNKVTAWSNQVVATSGRIGTTDEAAGVKVECSINANGDVLTVRLTNKDGTQRRVGATLLPV